VDRHHRVELEREIDPLGLDGKLEVGAVAVERSRPLHGPDADVGLVGGGEQPLLERRPRSCRWPARAAADRDGGNDRHDLRRLDADEEMT
jgi:hypothetical protein